MSSRAVSAKVALVSSRLPFFSITIFHLNCPCRMADPRRGWVIGLDLAIVQTTSNFAVIELLSLRLSRPPLSVLISLLL